MNNWKLYKDEHPEFYNTERTIIVLVNSLPKFKEQWIEYLNVEYKDYEKEKANYVDISFIGRYVISLLKKSEFTYLDGFFEKVENIYTNCDSETKELLTTGLLESIQNNSAVEKVDYHFEYNRWLRAATKEEWDNLIEFWERDRSTKTT